MTMVPKDTGYVKSFDGTRIYYEVRGEGKPIVLAYGIGCLMNHWNHQIRHFSKTHQTIAFDYRAHHKSDIPQSREHLTIDALAQDVAAVAKHLNLDKISLFGHSFGVQVSVRTYDMFPELISNLIFINGFVTNPLAGMFGSDLTSSFFKLFKEGYESLPETLSFLWRTAINNPLAIQLSALAGGFNLQLTHLKDIEIYARGVASIDLNAFITLFENMMSYDGRPVLERIAVPTLIIAGKNDSVTPVDHQEAMHRKIKGSEFLLVPYGSHCTQLDMPELVNLKIEQFYAEHGYK